MALKKRKIIIQTIVVAVLMGCVGIYSSNAEEIKRYTVRGPAIGDINSIDERVRASIKIDNIPLDRYKVVRVLGAGNVEINDYKHGTVMGLRVSTDGVPYYLVGINDSNMLTQVDKNEPAVKPYLYRDYGDNVGDVYWNYAEIGTDSHKGYVERIGPIDNKLNFKPAYQVTNKTELKPYNSKYPSYLNQIHGNDEPFGRFYFHRKLAGMGGMYGASIDYRNNMVKGIADKEEYDQIKGEWRYLGVNTNGDVVFNNNFPDDKSFKYYDPSSGIDVINTWLKMNVIDRYLDKNGNYIAPVYNYKASTHTPTIKARESTWNRLWNIEEVVKPKFFGSNKYVDKNSYIDYFDIGAPASQHLSGLVTGHFRLRSGGASYVTIGLPSDAVIDLDLIELRIIEVDSNSEICKITRHTDNTGMSWPVFNSTGVMRLQPGKTYKYEYKIKNRGIKKVYNPTINFLVGTKTNASVSNLILYPNEADMYKVDTNSKTDHQKELGKTEYVPKSSYYDIKGNRRYSRNNNASAVPPLNSHIGELGVYSGVGQFTLPKVSNDEEMYNLYGTKDPNGLNIKIATNINSKHQVSDETYVNGYDATSTTIDDLYIGNNALASKYAFTGQDMRIGAETDYRLLDGPGNPIGNKQVIKGQPFSLGVHIFNPNKNWDVKSRLACRYTIKDAKTGNILLRDVKQDNSKRLSKNSDTYFWVPVNVPMHAGSKVIVEVEIGDIHEKDGNDWYKGNNKFSIQLDTINPVDLTINEAMGDYIGDGKPEEIIVGSGETVELKAEVKSDVKQISGPVEVAFRENGKISMKNVGMLDRNNPQIVNYTFVAPRLGYGEKDKVYLVEAEVNPKNSSSYVSENETSNNKVYFKVRVISDKGKYECKDEIMNGALKSNSEVVVPAEYSSYTPRVTIDRRDKITNSRYVNDKVEVYEEWGPWYKYSIDLKNAVVYAKSKEKHSIDKVYFRSKYTKVRYAEGKDRDKISKDGFVDILEYPEMAKVKAGYGFEVKVETSYWTDLEMKMKARTKDGLRTRLDSGKTVYDEVLNRVGGMNVDTNINSMDIDFNPDSRKISINYRDELLCIKMPDGLISNSYDEKVIERIDEENKDPYKNGMEWEYSFKEKKDGIGGRTRKYYVSKEVKNTSDTNKYIVRVGTNKIGIGGMMNAKSFDAKEFEINVYGGRSDDLKDQDIF